MRSPTDSSVVILHFVGWDESRDEVMTYVEVFSVMLILIVMHYIT